MHDSTFLLSFAAMSLVIFGVAAFFIKKTFKNFQQEMMNPMAREGEFVAAMALRQATKRSHRFVVLIGVVFCTVAGLVALFVATTQYVSVAEFLETAQHIEGTIVRVEKQISHTRAGERPSASYYPVFSFVMDASAVEVTSRIGVSSPDYYPAGETIEVLYDPIDPQDARINSLFQLWATPLIFFAVSLSFFIVPMSYGVHRFFEKRKGSSGVSHTGLS